MNLPFFGVRSIPWINADNLSSADFTERGSHRQETTATKDTDLHHDIWAQRQYGGGQRLRFSEASPTVQRGKQIGDVGEQVGHRCKSDSLILAKQQEESLIPIASNQPPSASTQPPGKTT